MTVAFVDIDSADLPDASMITRISQQVGGSFGVAVAAVVLESVATSSHSLTHGFDQAFWWTVGFTVGAALASLLLPGRPPPRAGPGQPARGQPGTGAALTRPLWREDDSG